MSSMPALVLILCGALFRLSGADVDASCSSPTVFETGSALLQKGTISATEDIESSVEGERSLLSQRKTSDRRRATTTFWPTAVPMTSPADCNTGSEVGPIEAGVQPNGSFSLADMMTELQERANNNLQCLQEQQANQKQYRQQSRQAYKDQRSTIKHDGSSKSQKKAQEAETKQIWKNAKHLRKSYRHKIMKASFMAKILPKVVKLLAPSITSELAKVNLTPNAIATVGAIAIGGSSSEGVTRLDMLEYVLTSKVNDAISEEMKKILARVGKTVWGVVGKVELSIQSALVTSLGEIPFVGGFLADAASIVITMVYNRCKEGVNAAILNLADNLANRTTTVIVNEAMKGIESLSDAVTITDADTLQTVGNAAATSTANSAQADYQSSADAAQTEAEGVQDEVNSDGQDSANEDQDTKGDWENSDVSVLGTTEGPPTTTAW